MALMWFGGFEKPALYSLVLYEFLPGVSGLKHCSAVRLACVGQERCACGQRSSRVLQPAENSVKPPPSECWPELGMGRPPAEGWMVTLVPASHCF